MRCYYNIPGKNYEKKNRSGWRDTGMICIHVLSSYNMFGIVPSPDDTNIKVWSSYFYVAHTL